MNNRIFKSDLKKAINWSQNNFNDLPWRVDRSFYKTLVSEVMLQQTTVTTVKNRFEKFLKTYASMSELANASEEVLLKLWQGLGYYSRAIRLKEAARQLNDKKFIFDVETLKSIKGIGDYTSNALVAIGLNKPALAIDVNIERVLVRYFGINLSEVKKLPREHIKKIVLEKLGKKFTSYRQLHESLMDVGRVFCQYRHRSCLQCPLRSGCETFNNNSDYYLISKNKKKTKIHEVNIYRIVLLKEEKIYLKQRKKGQWLEGQWEVPSIVFKGKINSKQYVTLNNVKFIKIDNEFKTTITNHRFNNKVVIIKMLNNMPNEIGKNDIYKNIFEENGCWVKNNDLKNIPLTSVMHKILKKPRKA